MSATRPAPPDFAVREGFEWRAIPAIGWRLATPDEAAKRSCRHSTRQPCLNEPVAALRRGTFGPRPSWWLYCADHSYGRWVEGDQVMQWVLRKVDA